MITLYSTVSTYSTCVCVCMYMDMLHHLWSLVSEQRYMVFHCVLGSRPLHSTKIIILCTHFSACSDTHPSVCVDNNRQWVCFSHQWVGFKLPVGGAKTTCTHTKQLLIQTPHMYGRITIIPLLAGPVSDDESEIPRFSEDSCRAAATDERPSRAADTSGEYCHV